jgi:hypothetical protein
MESHYHEPMLFRFSVNAFLNALKSVLTMLTLDLERADFKDWRRARYKQLNSNSMFSAFSRGRDVVVHRGRLVENSRVEMGRFKYYKLAMAMRRDVQTDESSASLLRLMRQLDAESDGLFIGSDRSLEWEQLGVRRLYFEPRLSDDLDVYTAAARAWLLVNELLADAHELFGVGHDADPIDAGDEHLVDRLALLLETDVDPDLAHQWGWTD